MEPYAWSKDNSVEIEKGWIIQVETLDKLAPKIGRDPNVLEDTVKRYNQYCGIVQRVKTQSLAGRQIIYYH